MHDDFERLSGFQVQLVPHLFRDRDLPGFAHMGYVGNGNHDRTPPCHGTESVVTSDLIVDRLLGAVKPRCASHFYCLCRMPLTDRPIPSYDFFIQ